MSNSHVTRDSFICNTWLIHMRPNSFICNTTHCIHSVISYRNTSPSDPLRRNSWFVSSSRCAVPVYVWHECVDTNARYILLYLHMYIWIYYTYVWTCAANVHYICLMNTFLHIRTHANIHTQIERFHVTHMNEWDTNERFFEYVKCVRACMRVCVPMCGW